MRRFALVPALAALAAGCINSGMIDSTVIHAADEFRGAFDDRRLGPLVQQIHARFGDPDFAHAHWGVVIQSLDSGLVWYERNANRLFMPASNQKILTTAAALQALGPDFTFETALCHTGRIEGSTLHGDLVVFGDGDPTMYTRFQDDPRDVFRAWAAALGERGVERITGDVIGDDNAWDDENVDDDWPLSNLQWWYGAEFGPLQFNENYVDLTFTPPETISGEVTIEPNVPSDYFTIVNNVEVVEYGRNRITLDREIGTNVLELGGQVQAGGRAFERSPAITNPTLWHVTVLTEVLREEGIRIDGRPVDCDEILGWERLPEELPLLATHDSPPLSEIITVLMKRSQNLYAETMVRTMGREATGLGSFEAGREVVREELAAFGVRADGFQFSDGSGLSRYNLVSPRQIADIMRGMRRSSNWEVWYEALPIGGVDGTIRSRMRGTSAEGNVHAKTGTISNVRGLSGYVTTADDEQIVFSFLVNSHLLSSSATNNITDDVLAMVASFER